MRSRIALFPFVLFLAVSLVGCGGSDSSSSTEASSSSSATETTQSAAGEADQTVTIKPKGNEMKYKQTEFTVTPGATVKLVFDNVATSPSMQHNVVVINSTKDNVFQKVGEAGTRAGSKNDYVKEDLDAIVAHTPIAAPGETVSITFTVPEETGDYGYLCTFPGHWATMQGTMHVKKSAA